jgi:hypothetical protein
MGAGGGRLVAEPLVEPACAPGGGTVLSTEAGPAVPVAASERPVVERSWTDAVGINRQPVLAPLKGLIRVECGSDGTSLAGYGPVSAQPETALSHSFCSM